MKLNHAGLSKAVLAAAVVLVALLAVPSFAQAQGTKLSITGGSMKLGSGNTEVPIWPPITVSGSATVGKTTPAQLTLPTGVFGLPYTYPAFVPITTPPYIHVSTNISHYGPVDSPAVFKAGPKTSRPAAFNFCPGAAANPGCTTPATGNPGQGTKPGIVKYTPGGKQFGGTMKMLVDGTGEWTMYLGYTAPTIAHFPLDQPGAVPNPVGQAYANTLKGTTYSAPVTVGAVMVSRLIQTPGTWVGSLPGYQFIYTGFPLTTGKVTVQVLHAPPTYPNSTFTLTGSDSRTVNGVGNITLVAGGLSHTLTPAGMDLVLRQSLTLTLPEPTAALGVAGALAMLGLCHGLVRWRSR